MSAYRRFVIAASIVFSMSLMLACGHKADLRLPVDSDQAATDKPVQSKRSAP
ncbi:hypothetical protein [Aurantivibrio plasticivorans]